MNQEPILTEVSEGVATLTINNPPANSLSSRVLERFAAEWLNVSENQEVKAIVVTGAGNLFVAGADIREIASIDSGAKGSELAAGGQQILNAVESSEKTVIAAINGVFCLGGGLELAMACHIRIAGERVRLGQPEIDLGIMPGFGGTQRLPRLVGTGKALEMMLTGTRITAQEARAAGLVDQVVSDGDVLKQARGLARKIAAKGQVAVRSILKAVRGGSSRPLAEGLDLEAKLFGRLCETADMREGLKAFLEKRQPNFEDR